MEKQKSVRQSITSLAKLSKVVEQQTIEKYQGKTVDEIQKERRQLVEELNFEEADQIDKYLSTISKDGDNNFINKLKEALSSQLDKIFSLYDENIDQIQKDTANKIQEYKIQVNNTFQQMKEKHINQLTTIDIEKSLHIEKAKNRKVAKAIEFEKQAKFAASNHKIPEAILLRDQSIKAKEAGIKQHLKETHQHFEKLLQRTIIKQQTELDSLSQTLLTSITNVEMKEKSNIRILQKKVVVAVKNLLSRAISEGYALLNKKMSKSAISNILEEFVEQKLWDDDRADIFLARDL